MCFITSPDPHRGNDRFDRSHCGTIVVGTFSLWHCPAVTWRIWLYTWSHFIKMSVEKVIYAVLCVFSSACFMWCKSKDACPYFSFQNRHLAHLHSPNFSFFFFSSANYSWPTKPYPPTPFLSPSNGAELRFLHVVVESGRGERGAAVARTWELSEREDMTQICLLAS